jgi:hypothetical protein
LREGATGGFVERTSAAGLRRGRLLVGAAVKRLVAAVATLAAAAIGIVTAATPA